MLRPLDQQNLGYIREPWQCGTYAYIMERAYEITGDSNYLQEARACIETLLTSMSYTMANDLYTITYTDPADFPITELFGNAYGAIAAYKIYERTGNAAYRQYTRDFMNTLLRLTFWYEDNAAAADTITDELSNAGLFISHGGAGNTAPWENSEANLCLAWLLKHYEDLPVTRLLLKLSNLNRINSFHYYPPAWSDAVLSHYANAGYSYSANPYHPIEPFYSLGAGGHVFAPAIYMSSLAYWNYWMYEALAEANDPGVMVLNTDVGEAFDEAVSAAERHLIIFNPSDTTTNFSLVSRYVASGNYTVTFTDSAGGTTQSACSSNQLTSGIAMSLGPLDYARVAIVHSNTPALKTAIEAVRSAQRRLVYAYQLIQEHSASGYRDAFLSAMSSYASANYAGASVAAANIITALGGTPPGPTHVITPGAGSGGTVTPSAPVTVNEGDDQAFSITPDVSYHISDVRVDGVSVGTPSVYTFTNVTAAHTIAATFAAASFAVVEAGGVMESGATAGEPNLALASRGGVAFGLNDLSYPPPDGYNASGYEIANVNDGEYGHYLNCWIAGTANSFVGVRLPGTATIDRVAFGCNNAGGVYENRHVGTWNIQYTTVANPNANTPNGSWTTIGTVVKVAADSPARNLYRFNTLTNVTGVRVAVDRDGGMLDELEVYAAGTSRTPRGTPTAWLDSYGLTNHLSDEDGDGDGDRAATWKEYIAGTDPTRGDSRPLLYILNSNRQVVVRFQSVLSTGEYYAGRQRVYDFLTSTNLVVPGSWRPAPGATNLPATGALLTYTNAGADAAGFYRLGVRLD